MNHVTPKEVAAAVAADLQQRGLTQEDVAGMTGYKSRQAVAAVLKRNDYFTPSQADRFSQVFGYDVRFLLRGEGSLLPDKEQKPKIFFPEMLFALKPFSDKDGFRESLDMFIGSLVSSYGLKPVHEFLTRFARYMILVSDNPDRYLYDSVRRNEKLRETGLSTWQEYLDSPDYQATLEEIKDRLAGEMFGYYLTMQPK